MLTQIATTLFALSLGYLIGSFNTAVFVGKVYGKDITSLGSKGAGLTNTLRVLGKSAAALVLVGDVLKGIVACGIGLYLGAYATSGGVTDNVSLLAAGTGAVIGHNWPIYFGFKGGKGALTALSVLFVLDWTIALMCLAVFAIIVVCTRLVSLGTICAALFFVAVSFVPAFGHGIYFHLFTGLIALMVVGRHKQNIQRLIAGNENRLSF